MSDTRLRVTPHLAFGICLVAVGSTLALDRLGLIEARDVFFRFWPLGLVLLGLSLVIQSLQGPQDGVSRHSRPAVDNGSLVGLFIIGVVAFHVFDRSRATVFADSTERVGVFAVMGEHQQLNSSPSFRGGEMTCVMGRCQLDLRQATVAPGQEAVIDVFAVMGGAQIRLPAEWTVDVRAVPIIGGVKDRRPKDRRTDVNDLPGAPRLVIRGFIMMGGLNIKS
jgi:hypothetical protein